MRIAPGIGTRYRLTNRRIIVERGLTSVEDKAVDLDRFDTINIDVQPGQAWYDAGDLVFKLGNVETFRLEGVSRPAAFRETCLKVADGPRRRQEEPAGEQSPSRQFALRIRARCTRTASRTLAARQASANLAVRSAPAAAQAADE